MINLRLTSFDREESLCSYTRVQSVSCVKIYPFVGSESDGQVIFTAIQSMLSWMMILHFCLEILSDCCFYKKRVILSVEGSCMPQDNDLTTRSEGSSWALISYHKTSDFLLFCHELFFHFFLLIFQYFSKVFRGLRLI